MPDPDCNRVAYWPLDLNHTHRCTQPHGHPGSCWVRDPELMRPKHRMPRPTDEDAFDIRPRGGKHRAIVGASSGPNTVDGELRRRLANARAGRSVVEA